MACRWLRACVLQQRADLCGDRMAQPGAAEDRRGSDECGCGGRECGPQPAAPRPRPPPHSRLQRHDDRSDSCQPGFDNWHQARSEGRDHGPQAGLACPDVRGDGSQPAQEQAGALPGRLVGDPAADPLQAVPGRHDAVRRRVQRVAQALAVLGFRFRHDSCSSTLRSAAMPRAVCLFTDPLLSPMTLAICASGRHRPGPVDHRLAQLRKRLVGVTQQPPGSVLATNASCATSSAARVSASSV